VVFDISGTGLNTAELSKPLAEHGVLANGISPQAMRLVTHMDVDRAACTRALAAIKQAIEGGEKLGRRAPR
jgi:threonine aldolase